MAQKSEDLSHSDILENAYLDFRITVFNPATGDRICA